MPREQIAGLGRGRGLKNPITLGFQIAGHLASKVVIILDQQDNGGLVLNVAAHGAIWKRSGGRLGQAGR